MRKNREGNTPDTRIFPESKDFLHYPTRVTAVCGDLLKMGEARQARDTAEHALDHYYPLNRYILAQKAKAQLVMGQCTEVLETTGLILAMNPNDIIGLSLRAYALIGIDQYEAALKDVMVILKNNPNDQHGVEILRIATKKYNERLNHGCG